MADKKKADTKPVHDIAKPGKSVPTDTAKPIITHRPMIKDPMVNEAAPKLVQDSEPEKITVKTGKTTIQPLNDAKTDSSASPDSPAQSDSSDSPEAAGKTVSELAAAAAARKATKQEPTAEAAPETTPEPKAETVPEPAQEPSSEPGPDLGTGVDDADKPKEEKAKTAAEKSQQEAEAQAAKHEAEIQKLVDSRQYFLPVNAVEKRKSKHFVIFGVILAIFLAVAWADIALDAGLVDIGGVKPVTHFFSN